MSKDQDRPRRMNDEKPEWLTAGDVATLLRISNATVWRYRNAGYLQGYKQGPRLVRFKRAEVERMIEDGRENFSRNFKPRNTAGIKVVRRNQWR
ncbi:MAG: helix-turn-helix domain-containing protein [Thermodesulfobacteriota bacterium]